MMKVFTLIIFVGLFFAIDLTSAQSQFILDHPIPTIQESAPPPPPARAPAPPVRPPAPPVIVRPQPEDVATEAGTRAQPCAACSQTEKNIRDLQAVVRGQLRIGDLTTWNRSRGLVQMPTRGTLGNIGPCGSFHYNPDRSKKTGEVVDNYANPLTACVFMSLLQDWKKRCPDSQAGCRVAWGDISHKTAALFNDHTSHKHGNCIDIRPMRRGGFDNAPLVWQNSDRAMTAAFIKMAKEKGASPVLYNDPNAGAQYWDGHSNHMHVCFHSNSKTRQECANYKYDPNVCGPN